MAELAAIGLASNVLQFLEFGVKLFKRCDELYNSAAGATAAQQELETYTKKLKGFATALQKASRCSPEDLSPDECELQDIAQQCEAFAGQFLLILGDLKAQNGRSSRLRSLKQALRLIMSENELQKYRKKMEDFEKEILVRLVAILRQDIQKQDEQSAAVTTIKDLKASNDALQANTMENLNSVKSQIMLLLDRARNENALIEKLDALSEEARKVKRQQKVLRSLVFPSIRTRHCAIKPSHAETFAWIFTQSSSTFVNWLESGQGVYRIRGKAGSGKSTFMKFLANHQETPRALQKWAGSHRVVIASHFFWNGGTSMQKSQTGLLQTLLYYVLRQCPYLIEVICHIRWEMASHPELEPWTEAELFAALDKLSHQSHLSIKFCFFIDGLDEYTGGAERYRGTYSELAGTIKSLSSSSSIKICVSSRPWTEFETAFGSSELKLCLEELTKDDIRRYVEETLGSDEKFRNLAVHDTRCASLVGNIVKRAQGVFLWVYLVVASLLRGLTAEDDFNDLDRRLNELPDDLEEYFRHMLRSIESVYWKQTVNILQTTIHARLALPVMAYEMLEDEEKDPDFAMKVQPFSMIEPQLHAAIIRMTKRLNARCKDLLEVTQDQSDPLFFRYKVNFLHRTVRDFFLETDAMSRIMEERDAVGVDVPLSLCRITLALIKTAHSLGDVRNLEPLVNEMMHCAWLVEVGFDGDAGKRTGSSQNKRLNETFKLLDEMHTVNSEQIDSRWTNLRSYVFKQETITGNAMTDSSMLESFLAFAIRFRLSAYVIERLTANPTCCSRVARYSLMNAALLPEKYIRTMRPEESKARPNKPVVLFLLEQGLDPNRHTSNSEDTTMWVYFLKRCYERDSYVAPTLEHDLYEILKSFVEHGADPSATLSVEGQEAQVTISDVLNKVLWDRRDIAEIEGLLQEKRRSRTSHSGLLSWFWARNRVV